MVQLSGAEIHVAAGIWVWLWCSLPCSFDQKGLGQAEKQPSSGSSWESPQGWWGRRRRIESSGRNWVWFSPARDGGTGEVRAGLGAQRILGFFLFGSFKMGLCLALYSVWIRIWDPGDFFGTLFPAILWNWNCGNLGRRLLSTRRIILCRVGKVGHTIGGYLDRRLLSIRRIYMRGSMVGHTIGTVLHSPNSVLGVIKCLIASLRTFVKFYFRCFIASSISLIILYFDVVSTSLSCNFSYVYY
ncbi:hypothetical protein RchiOBHm_Chr5g0012511 [Rosa chinensis]|uniref:Uncharacterized protein n=1 Tax=Rosa chinensis TaxID=74649 RepID=A0A2P6Q542_ROSCH|nr:hypothetical protein RchiOBHm_Chr5g0012511 [Rosa chinensis]